MELSEVEISRLMAALKFAAEKHRDQRRKDVGHTPYINHPIEVAEMLWKLGEVRDMDVIIAALLHDIIEDTETEPEEISEEFGERVLSLVLEVTDDKRLPKEVRKSLQIERAPEASLGAKAIKLADKICNVRDVAASPPKGWSTERRVEYLDWTEKVVQGVRGCCASLEVHYDETLKAARVSIQRECEREGSD
ncbi:MAG: HD domain-containing protein [Acidobacteriota bacterium]